MLSGAEARDDDWCLEKHAHGHLFWQRRDSENSRVRFKQEVEVMEFERDPEERSLSRGEFNHCFNQSERRQTHPVVIISSCICAIAVTIYVCFMTVSHEQIE